MAIEYVEMPILENKILHHEMANTLHATLIQDGRNMGFDPFEKRHDPSTDLYLQNSMKIVKDDLAKRSTMTGPSIQREKYSSSYWRHWNKEKNLLEDMSYKQVVLQPLVSSQSRCSSGSKLGGDGVRLSTMKSKSVSEKKSAYRLEKLAASKKAKAIAFAAPGFNNPTKSSYFDAHLLGKTDVNFLMTVSTQQAPPVNPREHNATIEPDDIGQKHVKGGAISIAKKGAADSERANLTAQCDYPPQASLVNPNKGNSFALAPRFPMDAAALAAAGAVSASATGAGAGAGAGVGVDASVSTASIVKEFNRQTGPGNVFAKASRFSDRGSRPSVLLQIPIHNSHKNDNGDLHGSTNEDDFGNQASTSGAAATASSSQSSGALLQEGGGGGGGELRSDSDSRSGLGLGLGSSDGRFARDLKYDHNGGGGGERERERYDDGSGGCFYDQLQVGSVGMAESSLLSQTQGQQQEHEQEQEYQEYEYFPDDEPGPGHYNVRTK
jgi:hypothetical protein